MPASEMDTHGNREPDLTMHLVLVPFWLGRGDYDAQLLDEHVDLVLLAETLVQDLKQEKPFFRQFNLRLIRDALESRRDKLHREPPLGATGRTLRAHVREGGASVYDGLVPHRRADKVPDKIFTLPGGAEVQVLKSRGDLYAIRVPGRSEPAYIHEASVDIPPEAVTPARGAIELVQGANNSGVDTVPANAACQSEGLPIFGQYLASMCLSSAKESRFLLGGKFVRFGAAMMVSAGLFETGAALGHAMRDRFETLMILFAEPGRQADVAYYVKMRAEERVAAVREPGSLLELYMTSQMADASIDWSTALLARGQKKVKFSTAMLCCQQALYEGAGFGAQYPELFRELFEKQQEVDPHIWREAHAAGLAIPAEPGERVPLEERQHAALRELSAFLADYYPHLLHPLGLRRDSDG